MVGERRQSGGVGAIIGARFGLLDNECRAAFQIGAQHLHAGLGLFPTADHDVLKFMVQELFGGLFKLRIGFDEIRQDSSRVNGSTALERA